MYSISSNDICTTMGIKMRTKINKIVIRAHKEKIKSVFGTVFSLLFFVLWEGKSMKLVWWTHFLGKMLHFIRNESFPSFKSLWRKLENIILAFSNFCSPPEVSQIWLYIIIAINFIGPPIKMSYLHYYNIWQEYVI